MSTNDNAVESKKQTTVVFITVISFRNHHVFGEKHDLIEMHDTFVHVYCYMLNSEFL